MTVWLQCISLLAGVNIPAPATLHLTCFKTVYTYMWHTVWGVRKHEFVKNLGAACTAQFPAYVQLADVLLANECSNVRGAADAIVLFPRGQEQYCESLQA